MNSSTRVLILCTANSARSQMAEGLWRHLGGGEFAVESAGTSPTIVRPEAIAVMNELGIDISGHRSKSVEEFAGREFDIVVTVCDNARESCPIFPGSTEQIHWSIEDPADGGSGESDPLDDPLDRWRHVRDTLRRHIAAELALRETA